MSDDVNIGVASREDARPQPGTTVQHTPGPWRIDPRFYQDIQTEDGREVGSVWRPDQAGTKLQIAGTMAAADRQEAAANARLFAAAPDLLAALKTLHLKAVIGTDAERHDALNAAWVAIAKAEGS